VVALLDLIAAGAVEVEGEIGIRDVLLCNGK
jgi:hypothetical protein